MTAHSEFDSDTTVTAASAGVYDATLTDRWHTPMQSPNGGYSLAVALRALAHTVGAATPDPLVVSAFFLRRASPGPAQVHTELVRAGRRTATGEARLLREGQEIVRLVATFADLAHSRGRSVSLTHAPELPPPEACVPLGGGRRLPGATIADRVDMRAERAAGFALGQPSGDPTLTFWMRFADGRDADPMSLPMLVDAALPAVLELGERGSSTIELTVHVRAHPAPGWLLCRVVTRHITQGYHEEDVELWDTRGVLVAQARQLALLPETAD